MRVRSFLTLGVITLLVTGAAVVSVVDRDRPQSTIEAAGPVLPGLADRLADVSAVVIQDAGKTLTIQRTEGGWGLAEYQNYPVPADKVREIARALVQLEKVEAKTSSPEKWSQLSVEDVEAPGATSKLISLRTAAGDTLARLIVGKPGTGVGAEGSTYVRVPGDPQAWLARGSLTVGSGVVDWVDRRLFEVPMADIQQVRVVHPDKSTITVVREQDGSSFRLAELPPGGKAKLKRPDALDDIVQAVTEMPLEDLAPRASHEFPAKEKIRVTITRIGGGDLVFEVAVIQGEQWLRFVEGSAPAGLPAAAQGMDFRVPGWKLAPLQQKAAELVENPSG
jgi:hypothetical protein